jgi:hypothetical protein
MAGFRSSRFDAKLVLSQIGKYKKAHGHSPSSDWILSPIFNADSRYTNPFIQSHFSRFYLF